MYLAQVLQLNFQSVKAHSKRYGLVALLKDEPVGVEKLLTLAHHNG